MSCWDIALAVGTLAACAGGRIAGPPAAPETVVVVRQDAAARETEYAIASGDCRIVWTAFHTEGNRGVIRHRSGCALPLAEQAPLIGKLLRKVLDAGAGAAGFRTLMWGRFYPDGARDATMAVRLALAAKRSVEWDGRRGAPRGGDVNGWVRKAANQAAVYEELRPVFAQAGLEIRLAAVEKVLVLPAERLPFFEKLRKGGARATDRLPFDCQAWFSVQPMGTAVR